MTPLDSLFLVGESREHPMHVGGLMLFEPPGGAGDDFARSLYEGALERTESASRFRRRPGQPLALFGNVAWTEDKTLDLDYHVRLNGLPRPGTVRDLLSLVSRMHSSLLDRYHPLWELHIIEGLADGRIAVYSKIHHALVDGVSALRLLSNSLTSDPRLDATPFWIPRPSQPRDVNALLATARNLAQTGSEFAREALTFAPNALNAIDYVRNEAEFVRPLQAPRTMLNVKIGGARRFAAQSWEIDRLKSVAAAARCTLNDVVLAMCSGALRAYLLEHNALPDAPLIAAVPLSTRKHSDPGGGNSVSLLLCNLGTHLSDPLDRLDSVVRSIALSKEMMSGLLPMQKIGAGVFNGLPLAFELVPGYSRVGAPPFNLFISNVPGPSEEKYYNGSRLDGLYPVSVVLDGQALNITVVSRAGYLDFGLTGCRRSVPSLQRLLGHLEDSLAALEAAVR